METKHRKGLWLWYALAGVLIVIDQVAKGLVRATMALGESRPFLPHFIELYHVENTGGAFSIFESYTWILTALSAVITLALVLAIWKNWLADAPVPRLCVTLVLAGAAGNLIDRVRAGKVTDMFNFTFMRFGVFNVADICVVGGVMGYAVYVLYTQYIQRKSSNGGDDTHEADAERPQ